MTCSDVGNHLGDEEGVVFRTLLCAVECVIAGFLFEGVQTADTGCKDHTYTVFVDAFIFKPCISDSFISCHERIHCVEVELACFLAVEMLGLIEILHLTSKLSLELAGIEVCNRACAANAFLGVFPCCRYIIADRRQGAQTGYYNSF